MKHFSMLSKKRCERVHYLSLAYLFADFFVGGVFFGWLVVFWGVGFFGCFLFFLISSSNLTMTRKPVSSCLGLTEAKSTVCKRLRNQFL